MSIRASELPVSGVSVVETTADTIMAVEIRSVKLWMKAFIPRVVPGYTIPIPGCPGETMIPGPTELNTTKSLADSVIDGMAPLHMTKDAVKRYGYRTDQRSFSSDIRAHSRMNCECKIEFKGSDARSATLAQYNYCDPTVAYDLETGAVLKQGKAPSTKMNFRIEQSTANIVSINMKCAAADPVVIGASYIANIDFAGTVTVDLRERSIGTNIIIDNFPAFEAYATINDGAGFTIFQTMPKSGMTVADLVDGYWRSYLLFRNTWGAGIERSRSRIELHKAVDADGDGIFDTLR